MIDVLKLKPMTLLLHCFFVVQGHFQYAGLKYFEHKMIWYRLSLNPVVALLQGHIVFGFDQRFGIVEKEEVGDDSGDKCFLVVLGRSYWAINIISWPSAKQSRESLLFAETAVLVRWYRLNMKRMACPQCYWSNSILMYEMICGLVLYLKRDTCYI